LECLPVAVPPDVVERTQHILSVRRIVVCPKEPQTPIPVRINQLVDLPPKVFIDWVHDAATVARSKEIGKPNLSAKSTGPGPSRMPFGAMAS
jgi:hypothetical protein